MAARVCLPCGWAGRCGFQRRRWSRWRTRRPRVASNPFVVHSGAVGVIGRVGPTSWAVLTALAVGAHPTGGELIVRASVRSLAADLGLDKDTGARALVRLRREHLVVATANRFEPGTYRLTIPVDVIPFT